MDVVCFEMPPDLSTGVLYEWMRCVLCSAPIPQYMCLVYPKKHVMAALTLPPSIFHVHLWPGHPMRSRFHHPGASLCRSECHTCRAQQRRRRQRHADVCEQEAALAGGRGGVDSGARRHGAAAVTMHQEPAAPILKPLVRDPGGTDIGGLRCHAPCARTRTERLVRGATFDEERQRHHRKDSCDHKGKCMPYEPWMFTMRRTSTTVRSG